MNENTTKWVLIGAAVVLLVYWLSQGRSGGGTLSTGGLSSSDAAKLEEEQLAAQGSAFSQLAGVVSNVTAAREQTKQTTELANIQAGIENNRISAALQGLQIQTNAQLAATNAQVSAQKQKSVLDSIPVIGSVLSGILSIF